ncbi:2-oxoglutarate dehydrogenase complex dihydrolipoyllysine-residue succinyltransferase [Swaminathania salitolerans]|uniref:Dihydrolipoyllysine-residue succinyltransferase component of 2-oxoglutarate dehydrogenase complex n=1 Tax=Swaminathania salitolerans TaxID=182838 RepID=A0A511BS52_9PROT|nr:2-oxoglutarate dehydrogenase complex dihydrolipoyllysine-residue succinyltransferase [Swaminathania salitolerans]GBQ11340.1 2-oxoglutarate dehydrogenase E2 component [Swaminathania salitolerans LMG 21291]GEL02434.1 dihydrolipoyllysine-residue succinyltransferase component of 2-oxoglutarate dehydrogenase complex [Swaminathania salitolerans]
MSVEIKVPVLGESVTSATVTRWLKKTGEAVAADEPVVELETDKISVEVPAPQAGVLCGDLVKEGAEVAVGSVLGALDPNGKATATGESASGSKPPVDQNSGDKNDGDKNDGHKNDGQAKAGQASGKASDETGSGKTGSGQDDASRSGHAGGAQAPMPAASRLMAEKRVDPSIIAQGTGLDGRITKSDVIAGLAHPRPAASRGDTSSPAAGRETTRESVPAQSGDPSARLPDSERDTREQRMPMTRLRQTIARRLKEAQNTAAILTTFNEVDMSAAKALRAEYRESFEKKHGVKLGFMSIFARAVIEALQEFPALNATIDGDEIVYRRFVNLGIAVGSERGLVVPVLHDADRMGFAELERRIGDFGARARAGTLKLDELSRGTFSITNGGIFGSLLSTPILNTPQSGILGMHAIQDRPVAIDGQVVIRPMMYVALSYDHRMVDGREAVSFLVRVKQYVEDPRRLLLDV